MYKICNTEKCPKHEYIIQLEEDKKRILKGHSIDKKYFRKTIYYLLITCGVLILELIFSLAYGREGITMLINILMKVFTH